jgi:AraC-like DNA-binding protein
VPITRSWQSSSARIVLFEAKRGYEMIRETCPSTQIWFLLSGEWSETGDGSKRHLRKFDTQRYAPRQPCKRIVEADSTAVSIELYKVAGNPTISSSELRGIWQISHRASTESFDPVELEEHIACFGEDSFPEARGAEWLYIAREIIHSEFLDQLSLNTIANRVGISPNHLSSAFRASYGTSISRLIRRLRLEYALKRLETETHPWLTAGFYDASHFSRTCQAELGMTPGQIRSLNP